MYKKTYEYSDVSLSPKHVSTLKSRSEADTSISAFGQKYDTPIIAAPMPDVCDGNTAISLIENGAMPIIHRFMSIQEQCYQFELLKSYFVDEYGGVDLSKKCGCAIGVKGDFYQRFISLFSSGCRIFCLDTANGANDAVKEAIFKIRDYEIYVDKVIESINSIVIKSTESNRVYLIAGNVASSLTYTYLAECGVDAVRVGIGGGKVCTTRTETGVYVPMATVISECASAQKEGYPLIIADGGIRTPSDAAKALALGADMVMIGSAFAGTEEAPGSVINDNGRLVKLYRGAASFGVQMELSRERLNKEEMESIVNSIFQAISIVQGLGGKLAIGKFTGR